MGDHAWSVGDRVDAWIQERYSYLLITALLVFGNLFNAA